jgi:hypothetical protein
MAYTDNYAYPLAVMVWPTYVLLATGLVFFTSGALGFSLVPDVFALVLLLAWSDLAGRADGLLGLKDMGDAGFLTTAMGDTWNTTWRSQALCYVTLWLGLIAGKAMGMFLHGRLRSLLPTEPPRPAVDSRVVAAHVLNAGLAAPALAYACSGTLIAGPLEEPGIHSTADAIAYLTIMALGYAAGMTFPIGSALRARGLRRPGRSARVAAVLFLPLVCGWSWLAYSAGGWHGVRLAALCAFSLAVLATFALVTHWRFGRMRVGGDQAADSAALAGQAPAGRASM